MRNLCYILFVFMIGCSSATNKLAETFSPGANSPKTFLVTEKSFTGAEYYICIDTLFKWYPEYKIPEIYIGNYIDYFVTSEDVLFYNPSDSNVIMFTGHPAVAVRFIDNVEVFNHYKNEISNSKMKKALEIYNIFITKMIQVRDSLTSNGNTFSAMQIINDSHNKGL